MNQLICLLLGITITVNCSAQSFCDTSKIWHVGQSSGFTPNILYTQIYQFKQDSIVNNQKYSVLKVSTDSSLINWYDVGLFREDTIFNRVYWLINNQDELLYDFDLNIGDTAKVVSSFGTPYPNCWTEMILDSIGYNEYFGITRKHLYFNTPYYNNSETWIEGIGNLFGPIENKVFICTADYLPDLLCFSEGSELKWINNIYNDCYMNSSGITESKSSFEISCYPNPASDFFHFKTNTLEEKMIQVFNSLGERIFQTSIKSYQFELQLDEPGIYFMKIKCEDTYQNLKLFKL